MSVRVDDRKYQRLVKAIRPSHVLKVGIFGDRAATEHESEGITLGELADIHENGRGVPRRSFLGDYVLENSDRIGKMIKVSAEQVFKGKATQEQTLRMLGVQMVGEIQQRIASGISPELSDETIKRKGSSKPLIDTGQLRGAISSDVVPK